MSRFFATVSFCVLAPVVCSNGAIFDRFPSADISNGVLRAKVLLPDRERGFYRGTRFDWSGVIASLEYQGHDFFGIWFPHYDPTLHDAITGPVEEFSARNTSMGDAIGFKSALPREGFLKIGVGVLRKPDDAPYSFARSYDILNPGHRICRPQTDRVQFVHELSSDLGYSYSYEKTVRLVAHRPELILEHTLKNTGRRVLESDVYDHDFFVIDGLPTGPDFVVKFPFEPKADHSLEGLAEIRGNEWHYLKELEGKQYVESGLTGFSSDPKDNDIRVENKRIGIGVREIGDHPLVAINFWSIRTTICPEAYIHIKVDPGKEFRWKIRYQFYNLNSQKPKRGRK